jgi:hypothetical protein
LVRFINCREGEHNFKKLVEPRSMRRSIVSFKDRYLFLLGYQQLEQVVALLYLKVVGNEKNGRSGRSQMLRYDDGSWRSRFIYNLNMQFLSKMSYFLFRL